MWEMTEKRLLWRLLEKAGREDRDRYFTRAEELVSGKDPSRASSLGWIMNRMGYAERSIPLLTYAIENADDEKLIKRTYSVLWESYLHTGDWKRAEELLSLHTEGLMSDQLPHKYSTVAVAAAKAGAKSEAIRIWGVVAALNPSELEALDKLVKAGLKNELIDFYLNMQKTMPSSDIPARALMVLEEK